MSWSWQEEAEVERAEQMEAERQEWADARDDDAGTYRYVGGRLMDVADLPSGDEL